MLIVANPSTELFFFVFYNLTPLLHLTHFTHSFPLCSKITGKWTFGRRLSFLSKSSSYSFFFSLRVRVCCLCVVVMGIYCTRVYSCSLVNVRGTSYVVHCTYVRLYVVQCIPLMYTIFLCFYIYLPHLYSIYIVSCLCV